MSSYVFRLRLRKCGQSFSGVESSCNNVKRTYLIQREEEIETVAIGHLLDFCSNTIGPTSISEFITRHNVMDKQ